MNVFYFDIYFRDNETGKPFRLSTSEIAYTVECALQQAELSGQAIEREFEMQMDKIVYRGVFTE